MMLKKNDNAVQSSRRVYLSKALALGLILIFAVSNIKPFSGLAAVKPLGQPVCPIAPYVRPESYCQDNNTLVRIVHDPEFRIQSAAKLSGAVRIKTHVTDSAPLVEQDFKYWEERFAPFHNYLQATFPQIWEFCSVEKVNSWGLVITWEGTDAGLRPVMLGAHQDVVPIQEASLGEWKYPPFEGHFDGTHLWGRGSADCKNLLIGLLEAAEALHADGFRPKRTIVFAFGFDEELGGENGAKHIGAFLLEKYGKKSFYAVFDEGGQSLVKSGDVSLALVGTSEKGYLNYKIGLHTPGGHSSVPPDHTAIGIVSELVTRFENAPFMPRYTSRNPTYFEYQCIAEHSVDIEPRLRKTIHDSDVCPKARERMAHYLYNLDLTSRYIVTSSQAVDIIFGGAKSNALPEYVEVLVNHRIAVESSVREVLDRNMGLILSVARQFGLGVEIEGKTVAKSTANGHFSIILLDLLEPAPATPIYDDQWMVLAGSLRHVYEEVCAGTMAEFEGECIVPAPGMATGNTDSKHYWDLSDHIYRYRPGLVPNVEAHAHGANEHILFDSHLQIIAFYYEYLQLADTAKDS